MEFLSKIADAFDPAKATNVVTNVIQKVNDTVNDLTGSPRMNLQKMNPQVSPNPQNPQMISNTAPRNVPQNVAPQMQEQKEINLPTEEKKEIKEEDDEKTKREEILSDPKYKDQVETFKKEKTDYDLIVNELVKMESVRFNLYKELYDALHGIVIDNLSLVELNTKIKNQNDNFEKYTKLSDLYWRMIGHPLYGKLIPVKFPESVEHKGYYYTANGIIYYGNDNKSTSYVDPYVMYFTYFYKLRNMNETKQAQAAQAQAEAQAAQAKQQQQAQAQAQAEAQAAQAAQAQAEAEAQRQAQAEVEAQQQAAEKQRQAAEAGKQMEKIETNDRVLQDKNNVKSVENYEDDL